MLTHRETQHLPYTTRQIFDLVADVEKYAEFLPWCVASRILERHDDEGYIVAELLIGYKQLRERYTSKVFLILPPDEHGECAINVELIKGPFSHLDNRWKFTPDGEQMCIDFTLDFEFRTKLLNKLIGAFFHKATQKMVAAFRGRADEIYGSKYSVSK